MLTKDNNFGKRCEIASLGVDNAKHVETIATKGDSPDLSFSPIYTKPYTSCHNIYSDKGGLYLGGMRGDGGSGLVMGLGAVKSGKLWVGIWEALHGFLFCLEVL